MAVVLVVPPSPDETLCINKKAPKAPAIPVAKNDFLTLLNICFLYSLE